MPIIIEVVLGSLFVLLHAVHRFNTPPTNRSSTTAARYYCATLLYGGLLVGAYAVFVFSPLLLEAAKTGAHLAGGWEQHVLHEPLLIALLLTILLPTLPILEPLDEWVRNGLQSMAAIPHEARRLAAEMRKAPFAPPAFLQQRARDELKRHDFAIDDVVFDDAATPHGTWTKLTALMLTLADWEGDRRFAGFMARFRNDYAHLVHRYEQLTPKARKWFRTVRQFTFSESGNVTELAHQYQAELIEQCSELLQEVYTFFSRGLLKCDLTYASRTARLRALGFDLSVHRPRLTLDRIMMLFGSISVVFIFGLTFVQEWIHDWLRPDAEPAPSIGLVLNRTVMIAVIYVIAACCAILPKERWPAACRQPGQDRPVFFYFLASAAAAMLSLIISFAFGFTTQLDFGEAWTLFTVRYPWALMSFMTAFVTAWLADTPEAAPALRKRQALQEGLIQSAVSIVTACIVLHWLGDVAQSHNLPASYRPPDWWAAVARAAVIGFVIGYNVPGWYREAPREPEAVTDTRLTVRVAR